eukprot:GGOE01019483.1.p1 GENE.GGOE01019483.1~~GGOE01019483.1.p1  ORF type:complete len:596 (-),score=136.57 GGOE01019483.1:229-2016(-)
MATRDVWQRIHWNAWGQGRGFFIDPDDQEKVFHPQGDVLPNVVPFIKENFKMDAIPETPSISMVEVLAKLPPPTISQAFLNSLKDVLRPDQISMDPENRLCHSVGKNYRDLWRMRNGLVEKVPDAVLLPMSHQEVEQIMKAAVQHDVCLIPFGGGTNVVGAVEPDPHETKRMTISVDMRRMGRLLSVDKQSRTAVFEVGVLGPALEAQLAPHGLTFGHDPDSFVHSTLGGWIATRSSGAMSNKYGELEDMVVSLKVVTPMGTVITPCNPRAVGPDINELFMGSEGTLGIITEATVKAHPKPPKRITVGWLFPSFPAACEASQEMVQKECVPTIMRCYDTAETELSFAMKSEEGVLKHWLSKGIKQYLVRYKGFDMAEISLVIIGFDGHTDAIALQQAKVKSICERHNGFCVGTSAGENWQRKKYDLPLVRDFLLEHGMWADVLETSVVYSKAIALWQDVKESMKRFWQDLNQPFWIGCHMAHQYQVGACLYFTFGGVQRDRTDINTFLQLKQVATEAILRNGGSLTHHHGVGYEHVPWMHRFHNKGGMDLLQSMKRSLDPKGICNPGKLLPPPNAATSSTDGMMFYRMGTVRSKL